MGSEMSNSLVHPKYRADIDGLRAVAVLSVLVFHAFPGVLPGGFIGVDIFFVISGYLISTIIVSSLGKNKFGLLEFYGRRIKRIFPGLILVLCAVIGGGWVILFSTEFERLGKHVVGATGFLSNFLLQKESGYFDVSAETKPLLHLWSLAIEEQFYLIWPLFLMAVHRARLGYFPATVVLGVVSFLANLYFTFGNASKGFYWPFGRFWELLVGASAALLLLRQPVIEKNRRDLFSAVGALLLLIGLIFLNKRTLFPGFSALIPTMGALLMIVAGPGAWINSLVLSRRVLVWVGLISYPLYLWHWPLISMAKINFGPVGPWAMGLIMICSFFLAWSTYVIEQPIRFGKKRFPYATSLLIAMSFLAIAGLFIQSTGGLPDRRVNRIFDKYAGSIKRTERQKDCFDIEYAYKTEGKWFCEFGQGRPVLFAYGDSHALSLLPALESIASREGIKILFTGASGCPPLLGVQSLRGEETIRRHNCFQLNDRIARYVDENKIPGVLLIGRWSYYTGNSSGKEEWNPIAKGDVASFPATIETSRADLEYAVDKTMAQYTAKGVKVFVAEDNPQQPMDPILALRRSKGTVESINAWAVSRNEHAVRQNLPNALLNKAVRFYGATPISFDSVLCERDSCPFVEGDQFLYFDDDHLSVTGSSRIEPVLRASMASLWESIN